MQLIKPMPVEEIAKNHAEAVRLCTVSFLQQVELLQSTNSNVTGRDLLNFMVDRALIPDFMRLFDLYNVTSSNGYAEDWLNAFPTYIRNAWYKYISTITQNNC